MRFKGTGRLAIVLGAAAAALLVAGVLWGTGGFHAIVGGAAPGSEKSNAVQQVVTTCCGSTQTCTYLPSGSSGPDCCSCTCYWKYAGTNPSVYVCPQWCGAPCCWCQGAACLEPCAVTAPPMR